ncbi:MAG TPA: hypothetical protein PKW07_04820 [Syntrophorhabdaceae bacterium]|nr:hypothetical protein [Syntrophorhabdaceae bacterium]
MPVALRKYYDLPSMTFLTVHASKRSSTISTSMPFWGYSTTHLSGGKPLDPTAWKSTSTPFTSKKTSFHSMPSW